MKPASPLRYPGGKAAMTSLLAEIRRLNRQGTHGFAEPFAGGAGAALTMLFLEETTRIYINDADPAVHAFWWTLTQRPQPFLKLLSRTRVSMAEWKRQRGVYRDSERASKLRKGFAAFYLNRCNRSGIIMNGGPIGGLAQAGEWKIGARFNKGALRKRCEKIVEYKERITVSGDDGIAFIKKLDAEKTFFFIDPPYFEKGPKLYLNALDEGYHAELARTLKSLREASWVLTYDDCPEIRSLYRGWANIRPFSLRYTAAERRHGKEVMITPKWMRLPTWQESLAIKW